MIRRMAKQNIQGGLHRQGRRWSDCAIAQSDHRLSCRQWESMDLILYVGWTEGIITSVNYRTDQNIQCTHILFVKNNLALNKHGVNQYLGLRLGLQSLSSLSVISKEEAKDKSDRGNFLMIFQIFQFLGSCVCYIRRYYFDVINGISTFDSF